MIWIRNLWQKCSTNGMSSISKQDINFCKSNPKTREHHAPWFFALISVLLLIPVMVVIWR